MRPLRGMSFVDVVVGSAMVLIVFITMFGLVRATTVISTVGKAKAGATAVANSQIEYIRSLAYDSVGTVGGIPSGTIAQNATTSMNGVAYNVRTFIQYEDDPADGTGASDTNSITTDYKDIKVVVTYTLQGVTRSETVISNMAPIGIETTNNGGTLAINVVNASGAPVPGASVRIQNTSTSPTVDVTTYADSGGVVYLPGAATSTEYQVSVTKAGYSTAQTYLRDATNQNPTPGYLTVVKNITTTSTFAIDTLASLKIQTWVQSTPALFKDLFPDATHLSSQTNTTVSGGALALTFSAGDYAPSGDALSTPVAPSSLVAWTTASTTKSVPSDTTLLVQIADGSGTLIPDAVLPGNSVGFSSSPIDLSAISTSTYPSLTLKALMTTSEHDKTPSLTSWALGYTYGPNPVPNVSFTLTGAKTTGSTGGGAPIFKTIVATTTSGTGTRTQSLEWDLYSLALSGYDVVDACQAPPFSLSPAGSYDHRLYLGPASSNMALVAVKDNTGVLVPGASVTLSKSGYTSTVTTSSCGTAYFGSLSSANTYTVTISKTGYTTTVFTNVDVTGQTFYAASFE
jgi:hypothetical protein